LLKQRSVWIPKIGANRELKKVLESFWSGKTGRDDFLRET
jgi:hypothetical protein